MFQTLNKENVILNHMYISHSVFYGLCFIFDSFSKVNFLPLLYTHHNFSRKKSHYPIFSVWKKYKDKFTLYSEGTAISYRLQYFTFHSVSITYVDQAFNLCPPLLHIRHTVLSLYVA